MFSQHPWCHPENCLTHCSQAYSLTTFFSSKAVLTPYLEAKPLKRLQPFIFCLRLTCLEFFTVIFGLTTDTVSLIALLAPPDWDIWTRIGRIRIKSGIRHLVPQRITFMSLFPSPLVARALQSGRFWLGGDSLTGGNAVFSFYTSPDLFSWHHSEADV